MRFHGPCAPIIELVGGEAAQVPCREGTGDDRELREDVQGDDETGMVRDSRCERLGIGKFRDAAKLVAEEVFGNARDITFDEPYVSVCFDPSADLGQADDVHQDDIPEHRRDLRKGNIEQQP